MTENLDDLQALNVDTDKDVQIHTHKKYSYRKTHTGKQTHTSYLPF